MFCSDVKDADNCTMLKCTGIYRRNISRSRQRDSHKLLSEKKIKSLKLELSSSSILKSVVWSLGSSSNAWMTMEGPCNHLVEPPSTDTCWYRAVIFVPKKNVIFSWISLLNADNSACPFSVLIKGFHFIFLRNGLWWSTTKIHRDSSGHLICQRTRRTFHEHCYSYYISLHSRAL